MWVFFDSETLLFYLLASICSAGLCFGFPLICGGFSFTYFGVLCDFGYSDADFLETSFGDFFGLVIFVSLALIQFTFCLFGLDCCLLVLVLLVGFVLVLFCV